MKHFRSISLVLLFISLLVPISQSHADVPDFESISGLNEVASKYWIYADSRPTGQDLVWVMMPSAIVFGFDSSESASAAYNDLGGNAPDIVAQHGFIPALEFTFGQTIPATVEVEDRSDLEARPTAEQAWSWKLRYHLEEDEEELNAQAVISIAQAGPWVVITGSVFMAGDETATPPEFFEGSSAALADLVITRDDTRAKWKFPDTPWDEGYEIERESEELFLSSAMVANVTATSEAIDARETATAEAEIAATEAVIATATADAQIVVSNAPGGMIAFVGNDDNIWLMEPDGSNLTQLTESGDAASPSWSHDGTMLTWSEIAPNKFFNHQIMLLKDGSIRAVPDTDADCRIPVFNADDTLIIFTCNDQDNNTEQTRGMLNTANVSTMRVDMMLRHPTLGDPERWGHVIHIDVRESDGAILTVREESPSGDRNTWTITVYDSNFQVIEDTRAATAFDAGWLSSGQWNFASDDLMYSIVQSASGSIGIGTVDATGTVTIITATPASLRSYFEYDEATGYILFTADTGGVYLSDAAGKLVFISEEGEQFSWQPVDTDIALP